MECKVQKLNDSNNQALNDTQPLREPIGSPIKYQATAHLTCLRTKHLHTRKPVKLHALLETWASLLMKNKLQR